MSASSDSNKPNGFAPSTALVRTEAEIETATCIYTVTANASEAKIVAVTGAVTGAVAKPASHAAAVSVKASAKSAASRSGASDVVDVAGPTPYYRTMARFFAGFTRELKPPPLAAKRV